MNIEGKNVLVTGGCGLVGSHVVEELLKKNCNVIVTFRSLNPNSYFSVQGLDKKVTLVMCDIKNTERVFEIVSSYEIDVVFHIAAKPIVPFAYINPLETIKSNVIGTANVLEAVRRYGKVKAVVVASSDKAYGISEKLPYVEDMPLAGRQPYDVSKSCTDLIAQSYYHTYDLPITITRFGNIYGPGDLNFNRIIPGAIKAVINDGMLEIRSDGKMIREYIYVKDVARGYVMLAENIEKAKGEAFNLSSGVKMNVLDIVSEVSKAAGKKIKANILNEAKSEIPEQYLSFEKVRKTIGWNPEYELQDALKETISWYESYLGYVKRD